MYIRQYNHPSAMEMGKFNHQPVMMFAAVSHFTWPGFSPAPFPSSVAVTTWVVEVGAPILVAAALTNAEPS